MRTAAIIAGILFAASVPASGGTPAEGPKVRVVSFGEPANGLTKQDMTPEFLKALTDNWAESYRQSTPDKKIEAGLSFEPRYADFPDQRLAIVEMQVNNVAIGAAVFGLADDKLVRVICLDRAGDPIDMASGDCGKKIKEVFGVAIAGQEMH